MNQAKRRAMMEIEPEYCHKCGERIRGVVTPTTAGQLCGLCADDELNALANSQAACDEIEKANHDQLD